MCIRDSNYTLTVPISETVAIASPDAPQAACYFGTNYGQQAKVYTANFGINEWHIVTTVGEALGGGCRAYQAVSYTHLRAHETVLDLVCRLLLEKKTQ